MNACAVLSRSRRTVVAAIFTLALPLAAIAQDSVPPEALSVKVFPDRYVAAGKAFADLAALEAWAKAIRIRTVWLDSCGNTSTKQLLAAVERFHTVYAEGVQIRTLSPGDPGCLEPVAGPATRARALPADNQYLVTDRAGRSALP
jgi:ABC-type sugar transport system substrate-binding protein